MISDFSVFKTTLHTDNCSFHFWAYVHSHILTGKDSNHQPDCDVFCFVHSLRSILLAYIFLGTPLLNWQPMRLSWAWPGHLGRATGKHRGSMLTLHLLLRGFDVRHHSWHAHAVPVQVLQEDVCIPSGQCASLRNNGGQGSGHVTPAERYLGDNISVTWLM